ncbi:uncharacterized protein F5147DRAFT_840665 [Suillus discolor]|uniref:DUF6534 domain-containing protein n=1 Tax=Suillus discolor TaxID=1912936 RepID=A0A9P7EW26_9AGAM|nr:uncharacterized protein F5147DRAFT_840665 [Suillus discolor]KAG2092323.1 hypothetical protein F5147DRAFT_840665 [Suillus discolor]
MTSVVMSIMQGPLCGALANMLLYGVICMQTFRYWQAYEHNRNILKCLVAFIWILETAHAALTIYAVEFYLIMHFGDITSLEYTVWCVNFYYTSTPVHSAFITGEYPQAASADKQFTADLPTFHQASYIIGFIIAYVVNLCFIWRVLQFSQKRWIAVCFVIFATIRCGFGLANCSLKHAPPVLDDLPADCSLNSFFYPKWEIFRERIYPTMVVGWVLSAVVDSAIAFTLCLYLRKRRTGMKRTDNVLNRLLLYTINTGAVASFCAVLVVIMFLGLPNNLAFVGFVQVQSKLYAISLLASLNNRKRLEVTNQTFPSVKGVASSHMPRFSTFKPSQRMPSYLQPIEVRTSVVMDIYGDSLDTGLDSTFQE